MPMIYATLPTNKEAESFGNRAFKNPNIKKVKDGWMVWNERK